MTTRTQTLVQWLLERIAADEQAAREATETEWWHEVTPAEDGIGCTLPTYAVVEPVVTGAMDPADARHIATHDPARVLRQCAALRAVVHQALGMVEVRRIMDREDDGAAAILRALATIYADRPGADAFLGES